MRESIQPLLTSQQAAALLQIHPKTLQRLARRGEVPAIRIGRLVRFRSSDLTTWIDGKIKCQHHPCRG